MWKNPNGVQEGGVKNVPKPSRRRGAITESIEVAIIPQVLKTYKRKRFSRYSSSRYVCVFGDGHHCNQAHVSGVAHVGLAELKIINESEERVKKLIDKYVLFIVSDSIIEEIPANIGAAMYMSNKIPIRITEEDFITQKIVDLRNQIKVELKKMKNVGRNNLNEADEIGAPIRPAIKNE